MDDPLWSSLPGGVRDRVDALIRDGRMLQAIQAVREGLAQAGPAGPGPGMAEPQTGPYQRGPGLYECLDTVTWRATALGQSLDPWPSPPLDLDALSATIAALPGRLEAIEAVWDGDSFGWMIELLAVTAGPRAEHRLAQVRHGGDLRVFNGQVPPWPEAEEAGAAGRALAKRFGVPFRFASPAEPDDTAPYRREPR
ncbi:hypothetical protein [Nonomuraea sp. KM90]|uniref:hypothetical protein n=1 Tax=Nonomuraea sp. KM90 TaxID=3457428 RepID=UPI003FCE5B65